MSTSKPKPVKYESEKAILNSKAPQFRIAVAEKTQDLQVGGIPYIAFCSLQICSTVRVYTCVHFQSLLHI